MDRLSKTLSTPGLGIHGKGELRAQPANPGSPEKMFVKAVCVCVCVCTHASLSSS